jgi:hypothetical protein
VCEEGTAFCDETMIVLHAPVILRSFWVPSTVRERVTEIKNDEPQFFQKLKSSKARELFGRVLAGKEQRSQLGSVVSRV